MFISKLLYDLYKHYGIARRAEKWLVNDYEQQKKDMDFTEENFKKQFKQISRLERPNAAINKSLQESKNRITIYLDADIIEYFKNAGRDAKEGYQILINRTLREVIKSKQGRDLQSELLNDQGF